MAIDFSKLTATDIFNQTIVPIFQDLDDNAARIQARRQEQDMALQTESDDTWNLIAQNSQMEQPQSEVDYNAPLPAAVPSVAIPNAPAATTLPANGKELLKLSNYGYSSDSSPDTNSNILKIGHANNPLKDGLSAALTKTLAKRYGLKTGDMFEVTTSDGKVMNRRYDDTVPTTYKGKSLPETVDLYELKGNNNFSGKVVAIKPIR